MPETTTKFLSACNTGVGVGEAALPGIRAACLDVPLPASLTRANGANGES